MKYILFILLLSFIVKPLHAQPQGYWHDKERVLRYHPEGEDFVIVNGKQKFNRALYGTNTAFRVETSDVPEFGFFMPNMGGNMQLGLLIGDKSLWLNDANYIKAIYRSGARIYEIKDPVLKHGKIIISVLAMADAEGAILKIETQNIPLDASLITMFGGASNKRFFRNGDLGVDDPNAFALQPAACDSNVYTIEKNKFTLKYAQTTKSPRSSIGIFAQETELKTGSPFNLTTAQEVWLSTDTQNKPILLSKLRLQADNTYYIAFKNNDEVELNYTQLEKCFDDAEQKRKSIAETVKISTPDPYINPLGGVLAIAADGIWDPNCWQHGAVGWRMPLNGWRAAYVGDAIGWHDRARKHFDGYAASQIQNRKPIYAHPMQDKELNLTRAAKIWGSPMYSDGYICRNQNDTTKMHHYDMNLVYIDELLRHFKWTGDVDYMRKMWPMLKRHLDWEKRNFDPNDDGLYDAYACIWASDALMYNSGSVTYSSAYNYMANKIAAEIANKIQEDPKPYQTEADKILNAINSQLWLSNKGWWAEYKDFMGNKMLHPNAGIWTVYHAIDSDIYTPFQAYQATRYIDNEIPHIPVQAKGLKDEAYKTISTTNWLPYSWSVNNVAFAEVAHTSLAYWQAGRKQEAFDLFKSNVLDGMYLGASPGNIGQVSFYDATRGECYRDFGDPIGVYSRALIQGLFGIVPDAVNDKLTIRPGFPSHWEHASISTPDISFSFLRDSLSDTYKVENHFAKPLQLLFIVEARKDDIETIKVNDKICAWTLDPDAVGRPLVNINCNLSDIYNIQIVWKGNDLKTSVAESKSVKNKEWSIKTEARIEKIYDPQNLLTDVKQTSNSISAKTIGEVGHRTFFALLKQAKVTWWQPIDIEVVEPFGITYNAESSELELTITNNSNNEFKGQIVINNFKQPIKLAAKQKSEPIKVSKTESCFGSNNLTILENGKTVFQKQVINWNLKNENPKYEIADMQKVWNAEVNQIFKNQYLSPRSPYTTLQTPTQGIGEWCHPKLTANIDDSGLRKTAKNNILTIPFALPFQTTGSPTGNNIAFTSLWNNYPDSISVPLSGKAKHVYLLLAGSTNHMQSHVANGVVTVTYNDASHTQLQLVNPETWVPIEQDFYFDGYAFSSTQPRPYRVAFKNGIVSRDMEKEMKIKPTEVYGRSIDGGAGIILDIVLDPTKELKEINLKSLANEVVIGLMSVTLLR